MATHNSSRSTAPLLVGDIGGTHARLGIAQWSAASASVSIASIAILKCADYQTLGALLQYYLQNLSAS
ncbi:MAG TPA: glucokinase, partial [Spongiibacteraceae bacterium]|nr:glucokinase [Spongiibacteraceae bacterium]